MQVELWQQSLLGPRLGIRVMQVSSEEKAWSKLATNALVLSGGGTQGDFEVGVAQYLYGIGCPLQILCGTSVGSMNAAKLAEGGQQALDGLVRIWKGLMTDRDMWAFEPWVLNLDNATQDLLQTSLAQLGAGAALGVLINPVVFLAAIAQPGIDIIQIASSLLQAINSKSKSLINLNAIEALIRDVSNLDPALVAASGLVLRIAMVSLETGNVRYVDQNAHFIDSLGGDPDDLATAVLASSSIPAVEPVVAIADQHYGDGGVRHILPIQPAVDMGADTIFAVLANSPIIPPPSWTSFDDVTFVDIGIRTVTQIMTAQIAASDAQPGGLGWPATVYLISPEADIHDSMTIDPAYIDIRIDQGFMAGADVINYAEDDDAAASSLNQEIANARFSIVVTEIIFMLGSGLGPQASDFVDLRSQKTALSVLARDRWLIGGELPPACENWWSNFERHVGDGMVTTDPWQGFETAGGTVIGPAPPPGPLPASHLQEFAVPEMWPDGPLVAWDRSAPLNGNLEFGATPYALLGRNGTIHVFARGSDGVIWEIRKDAGGGAWQLISPAGNISSKASQIAGTPSAVEYTDSSIHVFARGLDGSMLEFYQPSGVGAWQFFNHLSDPGMENPRIAGNTSALAIPKDSLRVYSRTLDGSIAEFYQPYGAVGWQLQTLVAADDEIVAGSPAAHVGYGRDSLIVCARGTELSLLVFSIQPSWPSWRFENVTKSIPGRPTILGNPSVLVDNAGGTHIFGRGESGGLLEFFRPGLFDWTLENHTTNSNDAIASSPFALLDAAGGMHVYARSVLGWLLEYSKPPDAGDWQVSQYALSGDVGGLVSVRGSVSAFEASDGFHVFATGGSF